MRSRFGYRTPVPTVTARKGQTRQLSFVDGINTYKDNDDLKPTELDTATDARFVKIGRYKTRKGCDRYSVPVGEAVNVQQTSTTGASTLAISGSQAAAQKLTAASAGRATKAEVRIRSTSTAAGTVLVELYSNVSNAPGSLLARSSIRAADIGLTYAYLPVYFMKAPLLATSDVVWVVIRGQSTATTGYQVSTTTTATDGLSSTTGGTVWSAASVAVNVKLSTSTDGGVKGVYRSYRPNGQKVTTFAHGSVLHSVSDTTGAVTSVKTGLNSSATHYRFQMVQDALYFVNGLEKPYKWDYTTVTQITAAPYIPSLIHEHKGLLFFNDVEDKTRIFYSNFADYGTYTSTDFIYVPAPKSYDALTAFAKLNGVLFLFSNRNKFQLLGSDNKTFLLDEAPSQRGTFSQESLVYDSNFIYHADEEGVHKFNGTDDRNLAEPFLDQYVAIADKSTIQLELFENRLYIFYASAGSAYNDRCFVYNLLLDKLESIDKNTRVGRTFARYAQDNIFLQASNLVGAVYYGEGETNDYHNLGDQLEWELRTAYNHFDAPGQLKRVPKWRPVFSSSVGDYSVQVSYAKDMSVIPAEPEDVQLSGTGPRFNSGVTFSSGARFGSAANIEPTSLHIPGTFKRIQRRYLHIAAREPVEMDSEILTIETQRLI